MRPRGRYSAVKGWLRRADVILILILVVLGAGSWFAVRFLKDQNSPSAIKIRTSDEKFEIPLKDTSLVIPGPLGETEVRIEDKKVWVTKASCPNKLCMRQGKISRPGEAIICLPNRIVISIQGKSKLDAITY